MDNHLDILAKQEELLRFPKFDNETALQLGQFMIERAKKQGINVAVSIRTAGGAALFQHLMHGCNAMNDNWIRRKFNTVRLMECSSLRARVFLESVGEDLKISGLSEVDYALVGGGFPIRIAGSEPVIGAVICSNLFHVLDHEFVTGSLREFLNIPDAPKYPYEPN